ncbi:WLM-domain-containing protein [Meredithblackwellia eburnea MCA 4105]
MEGMEKMNGPGEIGSISALKSQPNPADALKLLKRIHSLVKPIMRKHNWYLPVLVEFFPKQPNLHGLNINHGQKICLRLRPAEDPHSFLDLEQYLIPTMLHELTHNVRGPHDDIFYKHLDGLQSEYDAMRAAGFDGEGFMGRGYRLGGSVGLGGGSEKFLEKQMREKMLKRVEEMARKRRLMGGGGRLGGAKEGGEKNLRETLADAAERRAHDSKSCGGGHAGEGGGRWEDLPKELQEEVERAGREVFVIDLTGDDDNDHDGEVVGGNASGNSSGIKEEPTKAKGKGKGKRHQLRSPSPDSSDSDIIIVSSTFPSSSTSISQNPRRQPLAKSDHPNAVASSSTSKPKPKPLPNPTEPNPITWSCKFCTTSNPPHVQSCVMCRSSRHLLPSPAPGPGRTSQKKTPREKIGTPGLWGREGGESRGLVGVEGVKPIGREIEVGEVISRGSDYRFAVRR